MFVLDHRLSYRCPNCGDPMAVWPSRQRDFILWCRDCNVIAYPSELE